MENVKQYIVDNQDSLVVNGTYTYTQSGATHTVDLEGVPYSQVADADSSLSITDLGGTGHWVLQAEKLLSSGTLTKDGTTYPAGTFSNWELEFSKAEAIDSTASQDGYAAVLVTATDDSGVPVDQNGRQRVSATGALGWYFVEETDYVAKISVRCGTTKFDTDLIKKAIEDNYSFTWKTGLVDSEGNDLNKGSFALSDREWLTFTWDDPEGNKGELLSGTATVKGLERFNLDGSELIFNIDGTKDNGAPVKITEIQDENGKNILTDGDYLAESIENNVVSNWGTNVDEVYSGGLLILTLTGVTEYTATKEWRDQDRGELTRPQADFYLWRFTKTATDESYLETAYQTASPVKGTDGQTAQFTISEGSKENSQAIDFHSSFGDKTTDYLPKYDQEGFEYVYISREYMSGKDKDRYKTVYGKVSDTDVDTVTDTLIYNAERGASDNSIYNTGTVSNMLSGTTSAGVTKDWEAAYFQSELTDVTVELTLQKSYDAGKNWTATEKTYTMGEENPFYAEFLTQSYSASMPKYDNYGRLLQYRWIETGVYQGTDPTNLLKNTEPVTFTLTQNGQQVTYTSTSTVEPDENGNYYTTILNKIEDETEYYVQKQWGQETDPEAVDLIIYRTNALNQQQKLLPGNQAQGTFQIDGNADDQATPLYYNGEIVGQVQEVAPWIVAYTKLQKYDTDGSGFDYVVLEGGNGKYSAEYSSAQIALPDGTTVDGLLITNLPIGQGMELNLRKRWLDEGDEQHRGTVTFTVYKINDLSKADAESRFADNNLTKIGDYTIDRSTNWWRKVWINEVIDSKNLLVLETKVAATDGGEDVVLNYTPEDMQAIYEIQQAEPSNQEPDTYYQYNTEFHKYEAFYSMVTLEENVKFYTVTNRRLGTVAIDVTKYWKDGSSGTEMSQKRRELQQALNNNNYELVLYLQCSSSEAKINYSEGTVTFGHEVMPVQDAQGEKTGAIQVIDLAGSEDDINQKTYQFYNLPKYDMNGRLVTYTVTEMARLKGTVGAGGVKSIREALGDQYDSLEYSFSGGTTSYQPNHQADASDKQTVAVTNALTGTKRVVFWKEWKDTYRYQRNERPDIYLDLYSLSHVEDASGQLTEQLENLYLDRTWTFTSEDISYCEFGDLNKYDDMGYEIFYYARERYTVDKAQFDYTDVYYKYDATLKPNQTTDGDDQNTIDIIEKAPVIGDEQKGFNDQEPEDSTLLQKCEEAGNIWLLKENGIFVNELQANVEINGKKIWANLPSGFLEEHLPEVTFKLYRYYDGEPAPSDDELGDPIATLTITDWNNQKVNGEYPFSIFYQGPNTNTVQDNALVVAGNTDAPLQKYDEQGRLYDYILREQVDLNGSAAEQDQEVVFKQSVINNYAITNGYDSPLGMISVKKIVNQETLGTQANQSNPAVSFTLTRSYQVDSDNGKIEVPDSVFSQTKVIRYNEFQNGAKELEFENLEIYAPNGSYYHYTITENVGDSQLLQGGYVVYAAKGKMDSVQQEQGNQTTAISNLIPRQDGENDNDVITNSWATFENVYQTKKVPLYFGKSWTDHNNSEQMRLKTLTVSVKRSAAAQPGMGNSIGSKDLGTMTLTLPDDSFDKMEVELTPVDGLTFADNTSYLAQNITKVTISSKNNDSTLGSDSGWIIQVESVEDFAPNGMPWSYVITETDPAWPYEATTKSVTLTYVAPSGTDEGYFGNPSNPGNIVNSMQISVSLWKNWRSGSGLDEKIKNPFGYPIQLEATLYCAGAKIEDGKEPELSEFNDVNLWQAASESKYADEIKKYSGITSFTNTISYSKDAQLGSKNGAVSLKFTNLPQVVTLDDGSSYALKYYIVETEFTLLESNQPIYKETFTPTFVRYDTPPKDYYYAETQPDNAHIGVYLTTTAQIRNQYEWKDCNEFLVTPRVGSKDILDTIHEKGMSAAFPEESNLCVENDVAPWPFVTYFENPKSGYWEFTAINDFKVTNLEVTKTWEDDNNNIYGTREPGDSGKWQLSFQLQRKDKTATTPDTDGWQDVAGQTATMNGVNNPQQGHDNFTVSFNNLPIKVLEKGDDGGYSITTYKYRAREMDGNAVVGDGEKYRDAYEAAYSDTETGGNYTTSATNTMETIDLSAKKEWKFDEKPWNHGTAVTFELKYVKQDAVPEDDGTYPDSAYQPFATPARVVLDGTPAAEDDKNSAYYADGWQAVWQGVPKAMPGSEKDQYGQTLYKVFETCNNAYATETGSLANGDFKITNEPTKLLVEKTIPDTYIPGASYTDEFTFTIKDENGNGVGNTVYYQKFDKKTNSPADDFDDPKKLTDNSFKLKNNQYVIIYGLQKNLKYTITESEPKGYTPEYTVTVDGTPGTTASGEAEITLPGTEPEEIPTVTVKNVRKGKLTIEKQNENGQLLAGVVLVLERKDSSNNEWEKIKEETTNANTAVVFSDLELGYTYRITEKSGPDGYNILQDSIEINLPYGTTEKPAWGAEPWVEIDGTYYYTDVTVTIGNNKVLVAPTTGGVGFFWPGLAGLGIVGLGAIWYLYSMRRKKRRNS